jgi:hypothetical protein
MQNLESFILEVSKNYSNCSTLIPSYSPRNNNLYQSIIFGGVVHPLICRPPSLWTHLAAPRWVLARVRWVSRSGRRRQWLVHRRC